MPDVSRDPDVAAVLKAGEMVPVYNLNPAKLGVFNVGVVDRSDTTNDTLYTGFEASFNAQTPGRRDAVRQLDHGAHAAAVVRQRRQPERSDDDRTVQPDRRHHRRGRAVGRPLTAIRRSSTTRSSRSSSSQETTRSRTRIDYRCGPAELRRSGAHHYLGAGGQRCSRTASARRPRRSS